MNQTPPTDALRAGPADALDRLLTDFFQAEMRRPWPPAPPPVTQRSEPSTLAAARPRQPLGASRDGGRARVTLAASVALLLGACWTLSNGFGPAGGPGPGVTSGPKPANVVNDATAGDPPALKEIRETKAKQGNDGVFTPPPVKFMP